MQETNPSNIIVYGAEHCLNCTKAVWALERANVPYQYVHVHRNEKTRQRLLGQGYKALPVVMQRKNGQDVCLGGLTGLIQWLRRST